MDENKKKTDLLARFRGETKSTGERPQIMLDLHWNRGAKAGAKAAFAYASLRSVGFNGSDELRLHFADARLLVRGRGLASMYENAVQHTLACIIQASDEFSDGDTVVESIEFLKADEK